MTTFQRGPGHGAAGGSGGGGGGDRGRERGRYAQDDVVRMAEHGEGHCRSCSSALAPFLWAFCELLGLDLLYREDGGATHQWLEFHCRPSMRAFCCDVYHDEGARVEGVGGGGGLLAQDVREAYEHGGMWPAPTPCCLSGQYQLEVAALDEADVEEPPPHFRFLEAARLWMMASESSESEEGGASSPARVPQTSEGGKCIGSY